MMRHVTAQNIRWISFACVCMTFVGVHAWSKVPFLFFRPVLISAYIFMTVPFVIAWYNSSKPKFKEFWPLYLFLIWISANFIRGILIGGGPNPLEFLVYNGTGTLMILSILYVAQPNILQPVIAAQKKWILPLSIVMIFLLSELRHFGFYIPIIQIFLIFFCILNRKTKIVVALLAVFTVAASFSGDDVNRSTFAKFSVAFLLGMTPYFRFVIKPWLLKIVRLACFATPFALAYMGIWGGYNVFAEGAEQNEDNDMYMDSRTTVYEESIMSAIENDYAFIGRTPARGYDSAMELARNNNTERYAEVSAVNIFTWYGLIGLVLYSILFWWITGKGIYQSNNIYIQLMALYLCFRFVYAWIEDFNRFNAVNLTLWIMMSLCLLPIYRQMDNATIKRSLSFLNL